VTPAKLWSKHKPDKYTEKSTFFCSELVAASYKRLGLLPAKVSASQYWPGAFAADRKLKLIDAKLGGEYMIDFNIP
jgi:hypothetical protein